jgi:uncharacterized protein
LAKILLVLALVIVAYLLFRGFRRDAGLQNSAKPPKPRAAPAPEDMVRCSVCGVHLPRSESFTSRGRFFCTDEHRRLGSQDSGKQ